MAKMNTEEAMRAKFCRQSQATCYLSCVKGVAQSEECLCEYGDDSDKCKSCPGLVEAVADVVFLG